MVSGNQVATGEVYFTKGRAEVLWQVASVQHVRGVGQLVTLTTVDGTGRVKLNGAEVGRMFQKSEVGRNFVFPEGAPTD